MPTEMENPLHKLTDEQIEAIGKEFDELHDEVFDSLGERDAKYIRGIIALHRRLVLIARLELLGAKYKPMWVLGTATLGVAKILENMEIGHNVMHGQWDWMNDPVINSTSWDWDTASTKEAWKHSHNYIHHTYTNVLGLDKDLGYEVMRIDPNQKWHPRYLGQPVLNLFLMAFFEWGVAVHDLDIEAIRAGDKKWADIKEDLKGMGGKARAQVVKDYIAFPRSAPAWPPRPSWACASSWSHAARARRSWPTSCPAGCGAPRPRRRPPSWPWRRSGARSGPTSPPTSSATCGPTRSSSAATSPTRRTCSRRRTTRTSRGAPATCASCSAPPTSTAARCSTYLRQPRLPGRAPPVPGHAEHALRRDRAEGTRDLRALRAALQHRPVPAAVGDGAAHDPAAGVPRRQAAPEAGPYKGDMFATRARRRIASPLDLFATRFAQIGYIPHIGHYVGDRAFLPPAGIERRDAIPGRPRAPACAGALFAGSGIRPGRDACRPRGGKRCGR